MVPANERGRFVEVCAPTASLYELVAKPRNFPCVDIFPQVYSADLNSSCSELADLELNGFGWKMSHRAVPFQQAQKSVILANEIVTGARESRDLRVGEKEKMLTHSSQTTLATSPAGS
jgi:hypothetical protein